MSNESTPLTGTEGGTLNGSMFLETSEYLAENWKCIIITGVFNILTGVVCLLFPFYTTRFTSILIVSVLFTAGIFNIFAICSSATPGPTALIGILQVFTAALMYSDPFLTLSMLTIFIAAIFMILGFAQVVTAWRNKGKVAARILMMFSGAMAIAMSVIILLTMETSKWFTIGLLVGVNLINLGTNRIVAGFYGHKIAKSQNDEESMENWRSVLDADIV
mmetsp:Transcript_4007/g.5768  ORF Transcript_4007/g.5768 Transcript_4007/m.5768 type:complete len:219 (-) Transcript_4007:17-673(-)|eukprot:CAMPEP_0194254766 /NCGR_PEP_ID=MMETSP0158-20130606/32843_1 /TAXON_ID=33649 /ORGANISM="Thalassionema nitzschioides, Strain L26-B" /LENGTH=218 /DNA_ID=CAMNT_0038992921 /DNA_START=483 /DNA_END=1139 /DNA_ORIENTATION=-